MFFGSFYWIWRNIKLIFLEIYINRCYILKGRCKLIEFMYFLFILVFAVIINIVKFGEWSVKLKIVVFRYLWCLVRLIKVISLDDCL